MLTIAFCFHQESIFNQVQQEITKGFSRRGVFIRSLPAKSPMDLLQYAKQGTYPDIIVFSDSMISKEFINTFLFLKEQKHSIVFILSKTSKSFNHSIKDDCTFLLQPFYSTSLDCYQELWSCVCKAYDLISSDRNTFAYYHRPSYHSTPLNHILYFVSEGRCITLVTKHGSDSFYGRLSDLEDSLSVKNCRFIRVHQSYLVNRKYITSFNRKYILLTTGELLPISKSDYYHALLNEVYPSLSMNIAKA